LVIAVLAIGVINFAVGYAIALYLEYALADVVLVSNETDEPTVELTEGLQSLKERIEKDIAATAVEQAKPVAVEDIPDEWLESLESESIEASSFMEASVQVLRLEVGKYREKLVAIEERIREGRKVKDTEEVATCVEELKTLNQAWLDKQNEAASHLSEKSEGLGGLQSMGEELEGTLLEQSAQIETTISNLELLDFSSDMDAGCDRLIFETSRLVDLAHQLRDRMHESIMSIMKADRKLETLDRKMQMDGLTTLHNRSGLEVVFLEWWREDIARQRMLSVVMVDIDRFGKINEELGTHVGDSVLGAFGPMLNDLVRKDRGFDLVARYGSERFILFLGDTGPHNAMAAAERVRQSIAETSFMHDEQELRLTVSCGVTEANKKDTTETAIDRLQKTLRHAQKNGRNCTALDEGEGPATVDPPEFQVKGRIITLP